MGVEGGGWDSLERDYLIVSDEGGFLDLLMFVVFHSTRSGRKFIRAGSFVEEEEKDDDDDDRRQPRWRRRLVVRSEDDIELKLKAGRRWVLGVSIFIRKTLKAVDEPMKWCGHATEDILNLFYLNRNFLGLICRFPYGEVEMPKRESRRYKSVIGHLDGRTFLKRDFDERYGVWQIKEGFQLRDLEKSNEVWQGVEMGDPGLMDLCMMSSKLAYENQHYIRDVVQLDWGMHFVDFYDCWNDNQKQRNTQVFVTCDRAEDANLIVVSFRGTEPLNAYDWISDWDYSCFEIDGVGRVHTGFMEALGLGNRNNMPQLRKNAGDHSSYDNHDMMSKEEEEKSGGGIFCMSEKSAYYTVKLKLEELLELHKNAKFVVTGHSLGGALAILFPTVLLLHEEKALMERMLGVYTFGQPRVGDACLAKHVQDRLHLGPYVRVVYSNDCVPRIPSDALQDRLYKHFGTCIYYNCTYDGKIVGEKPNKNYFDPRYFVRKYATSVWELFRSLGIGLWHGPEYRESWHRLGCGWLDCSYLAFLLMVP